MSRPIAIFTDLGGVLLTNGWDRHMRERAANHFGLDIAELDERHNLAFDAYEEGKISLDEYLERVVFHENRSFTKDDYRTFMFDQSQPFPEMLDLIRRLKARHGLKIVVISNEGRELTAHRIAAFGLRDFVDIFVVSCYVHFRKPDADIFRIALDVSQMRAGQTIYLEDRPLFVEVARDLGIPSLRHVSYAETRASLSSIGLSLDDG
ncbi:MAG TPA: HAD family hydrolase [Chloroflexota bacterium]|nr:HAD family hydrolase [Chloroflexota bacterium]